MVKDERSSRVCGSDSYVNNCLFGLLDNTLQSEYHLNLEMSILLTLAKFSLAVS